MASDSKPGASGEGLARVQALDLLRLAAVLGVLLFHYGFRGPTTGSTTQVALPGLAAFARYGFLGVPIFFIISGFVIAYSAEGRTATDFAIARIARIYPGFLFCMTITFLAILVFGAPTFDTGLAHWAANLVIAAPALRQPYMDSAYWSLIYEITFYAWVAILIVADLFRCRIDAIVLTWLLISMLNELVLDSYLLRKVILTDASGFFATGLLIYQLYLGRRDAVLQTLLATSVACAVFQAVHNLAWLRDRTGSEFDDWIVATICLASIVVIIWATRIKKLPLHSGLVLAAGGLTYPLYLLHQYLGYVVLNRIGPLEHPTVLVALILLAIAILSWAMWRYVERPSQRFTKQALTGFANHLRTRLIGGSKL
jgi:peptidoglycan/LPS O-acetylase OafA/YrhL